MKKCVICGKEIKNDEFFPFCSARCKNVDLGRWFNGSYVVHDESSEKKSSDDVDSPRQTSDNDVYQLCNCPDSSVGRAED